MGIIPPGVHRILDWLAVVVFAVAPTVFNLHGNTAVLAYCLAAVHLLITLLTQFPAGARRPIAFHLHGAIELAIGILFIAVPLMRHWTFGARRFYIGMGIALLIMLGLSRYRDEDRVAPGTVV